MKFPFRKRIKELTSIVFLSVLFCCQGCSGDSAQESQSVSTPEGIIKYSRLDLLTDKPYYFPALDPDSAQQTVQILKKWDMIFVGGAGDAVDGRNIVSRLIPGKFDHLLVYVGKDEHGNGYAAELNIYSFKIAVPVIKVEGGIGLICLGTDYAQYIHPTGANLFKENFYTTRHARTFKAEYGEKIKLNDQKLTMQVMDDLKTKFPYQLEFNKDFFATFFTGNIVLIDDGRANGAGCADYWTSLFEEDAQICVKGARLNASEIMDYFMNDPVGKSAAIPSGYNPLGSGDILVSTFLHQGFTVVDSPPHTFSCDASSEVGVVTPTRFFSSDQLEEPDSVVK
jgi:hypothetical protein